MLHPGRAPTPPSCRPTMAGPWRFAAGLGSLEPPISAQSTADHAGAPEESLCPRVAPLFEYGVSQLAALDDVPPDSAGLHARDSVRRRRGPNGRSPGSEDRRFGCDRVGLEVVGEDGAKRGVIVFAELRVGADEVQLTAEPPAGPGGWCPPATAEGEPRDQACRCRREVADRRRHEGTYLAALSRHIELGVDQHADTCGDLIADRADLLDRPARRVGDVPLLDRVGTYGQASPQPIVTAKSARSCISRSSFFGCRSDRSMPTSRMTSITSGHTARPGSEPADSARTSGGASRSKNACAICERPALWLQTKSTYFIAAPLTATVGGPARCYCIDKYQFNRYS